MLLHRAFTLLHLFILQTLITTALVLHTICLIYTVGNSINLTDIVKLDFVGIVKMLNIYKVFSF